MNTTEWATQPDVLDRLCSTTATHYGNDGPTVTIMHTTTSGGVVSTTGRLIAETPQELALIVHGSPVVISTSSVTNRTDVTVTDPA